MALGMRGGATREVLGRDRLAFGGRGSIPRGNDFRMLFGRYFEGMVSRRGNAWRCRDSLSLLRFRAVLLAEQTPDQSGLKRISGD